MTFSLTQSREFIGDTIGDDTILINLTSGAYYSLTPAGGAVWVKVQNNDQEFSDAETVVALIMLSEGIFETEAHATHPVTVDTDLAYLKYTEMSELLLADPIHEVDEDGWPKLR